MMIRSCASLVGAAMVVGFVLVGCGSEGGSDGTVAPCAIDTAAGADKEMMVTLVGSGQCQASISATVTVENRTDGECSSDILGTIQPGNHRMWFASESGYGGATGRWEEMPETFVEGIGIVLYPEGPKSWPITLPSLSPGEYTFTISVASCELGQRRVDMGTAFTVSTAPA